MAIVQPDRDPRSEKAPTDDDIQIVVAIHIGSRNLQTKNIAALDDSKMLTLGGTERDVELRQTIDACKIQGMVAIKIRNDPAAIEN